MNYNVDQLYQLISYVVNNKPRLREWDDLLSLTHDDPFTEEMAQRLLHIQETHSDIENGLLLNDIGVEELNKILSELRCIDCTTEEKKST